MLATAERCAHLVLARPTSGEALGGSDGRELICLTFM